MSKTNGKHKPAPTLERDPESEMTTAEVAAFVGVARSGVHLRHARFPHLMPNRMVYPSSGQTWAGHGVRLWARHGAEMWLAEREARAKHTREKRAMRARGAVLFRAVRKKVARTP